MVKTENFKQIVVGSKSELREWLNKNHTQKESVWLVTYKKGVFDKYVSVQDVLDELLCFGWIDGIRRKLDDEKTMQLISPRKVEHWTKTYKDRYAKLLDLNLVHPAGVAVVEKSKEKGLWNFMDDVDQLKVPEDLQKALVEVSAAEGFFNAINDSSKRFVLRWIKLAKTEKTREIRIKQIVELSAKGEKLKGS